MRLFSPWMIRFLILYAFITGMVQRSNAQTGDPSVDQLLQIGTPNNSMTLPVPMGQVTLNNGNLHLEIPIKSVPQPSGPSVTYKLVYDSKTVILYTNGNYESYWIQSPQVGWHWQIDPLGRIDSTFQWVDDTNCPASGSNYNQVMHWSNFHFTDSSGTTHVFPEEVQEWPECYYPGLGGTASGSYSLDGSGYYLKITTDQMNVVNRLEVWDPHGSLVATGGPNPGDASYRDSNGNSPTRFLSFDANHDIIPPAGYSLAYTPGGYLNTHFGGMGAEFTDTSGRVLSSLTLPGGRSYSFEYDLCTSACSSSDYHYGILKKMKLPTGQEIAFNYQVINSNSGATVGDLRVTSVSLSGETLANCADPSSWSGKTWSICYHSTGSVSKTTTRVDVTAPSDTNSVRNQLVYTGGSPGDPSKNDQFIPADLTLYKGLASSNTMLRKTVFSYDNLLRIIDVATQLDDGTSTHIGYQYWAAYLPMIKARLEYGSSGNLLRETDSTYTTNYGLQNGGVTEYEFPHIIDRVLTTTVYGSSGNTGSPVAQASYFYDDTPVSGTSGFLSHTVTGLASHDDTHYGTSSTTPRGNITGIARLKEAGSPATISTSQTYNILGQVISSTQNGNTINYDWYSTSWGDSSCGSELVTAFQTLVVNPLGQQTKTTYNSCDGTVHSVKDPNDIANTRNGTAYSYDGLGRVTGIDYPDGGSKTVGYGGSQVPEVVTTSVATDNTTTRHWLVTTETLDSLGRVSTKTSPDGRVVDTTYDNLGNVYCVSNPHLGLSNPTDGTTCHYVDALDRETQTLSPGESGANAGKRYQYSGKTTDFYDETGRHWKKTADEVGRLFQVRELGSTSSPLNLLTTYGYDSLNNLTSVVQSGPGGATRSRYFKYDALSRLRKECNPETRKGSTCDGLNNWNTSYDYYDSGSLYTRTETRGVQTVYSYDTANRLISKTFSGGSAAATRSSCYQYDTAANGVGRLGVAWTQVGSCPASPPTNPETRHTIISYNEMGQITEEKQCHRDKCSTGTPVTSTMHYDLAGNPTYYSNGIGSIALSLTYDAGRLHTIDSSLYGPQLPSYPASLLTVGDYGPTGSFQNMNLGPSVFVKRTFDNRLRLTSQTVTHP